MDPVFTSVRLKVAVLILVTIQLRTGESDFFISGVCFRFRICTAKANTTFDMSLNALFFLACWFKYSHPRENRICDY